jgi:glutathione S-transferase
MAPTMHHIPICPFSQRLAILLALKGKSEALHDNVVDITKPRDAHILELTSGTTALPVMELEDGRSLKESMVLMSYLEDLFPDPPVRRTDHYERAIENLMVSTERKFVAAGYILVMNQDRDKRDALITKYFDQYRALNAFLQRHAWGDGPWLFDRFGWAECIYTPFFRRFSFVKYYEDVDIDGEEFSRVRQWRDACLSHPAAQQVTDEEVIKLYYDYARNAGNGALLEGRQVSTFTFEPHWKGRPMPPKDKYGPGASDEQLGLLG